LVHKHRNNFALNLEFQKYFLPLSQDFSSSRALLTRRPDDGGSKHLWNVSKLLPDYTAQLPILAAWEPQISHEELRVFYGFHTIVKVEG
jgi:hypothetical protein